jgi:hypothetical protein
MHPFASYMALNTIYFIGSFLFFTSCKAHHIVSMSTEDKALTSAMVSSTITIVAVVADCLSRL